MPAMEGTTTDSRMTRNLQHASDVASLELKEWTAVLPFITRSEAMYPMGSPDMSIAQDSPCDNILEYVKPMYKGHKIYFSAKYSVHGKPFGAMDQGWKDLLTDLEGAGMLQGFYPIGNGGSTTKRHIVCRGFRKYQGTKQHQHSPSKQDYRSESLHSDRNNSRGLTGKRMPRKTRTTRALDNDSLCPFRFTIGVDDIGFYLVGGNGCSQHRHHPKISKDEYAIPTRLICAEEKDILVSVGSAKANDGVGRNIHFSRCGYVIPRSQVRYINGFQNTSENASHDNIRRLLPGESSVDKLLKSFKDKGLDHCVLYHQVRRHRRNEEEQVDKDHLMTEDVAEEVVVNETFGSDGNCTATSLSSPSTSIDIVMLPDVEVDDMHSFAKSHRRSLSVQDKQDLMIGCAWTTPPEKRLFKMFSEVLHIDCTSDTNVESRPFLTITGRSTTGKMFSIIRAFLPNERAWVFRWLFQTVMPTLLGKDCISRVKVIITDGDSQETSQLDIAIAMHFQNVCRVRCGWHIVDRGWKRVCPTSRAVSRPNQPAFKVITIQLKAWLYSWMLPCCETEEEYKISKALLGAYLRHSHFLDVTSEAVADQIGTFIRENVEPLEAFFCFHTRRHVRHFDTYTNSAHEGTNNGLKAAAAPVLPQHSLDRSASILNNNALIKANANTIMSARVVSSNALWSKLPTSQKLTHKGEGLVTAQWELRDNYISQRVGDSYWLVAGKARDNCRKLGLVPSFSRIRKVSIDDDGILLCSCMYFERIGIPCRHQMHVLTSIDEGYAGITHHDVSVIWWNEFVKYAFSNEPHCRVISSLYQTLLSNDICGPSIPVGIELPPVMPNILDPLLVVKPTVETCVNYDVETINLALRQSRFNNFESNLCCGDDFLLTGDDNDDYDQDFGPCDTQQETNTYGTDDCGLVFPNIDSPQIAVRNDSPYGVLHPLLKELASILEGNCTVQKLTHYKDMLSNSIAKEKRELLEEGDVAARALPSGKMVSSSVVSNKRHKSHGTKHMAFS